MINRFKSLFAAATGDGAVPEGPGRDEELHLAAAALLVEAACLDGHFHGDERDRITALLGQQFDLADEETATLIDEAEAAINETGDLFLFTKVIKDRYSAEERVGMIEMLWEVAFADGELDHFEANLIRRVGGLIYVSDRDRGEARKRVMARLGMEDSSV